MCPNCGLPLTYESGCCFGERLICSCGFELREEDKPELFASLLQGLWTCLD